MREMMSEGDRLSAARGGFETQRAGTGEQIEAALAVEALAEPVEKRFADAIGRRPQTVEIEHCQRRALPVATDPAWCRAGRQERGPEPLEREGREQPHAVHLRLRGQGDTFISGLLLEEVAEVRAAGLEQDRLPGRLAPPGTARGRSQHRLPALVPASPRIGDPHPPIATPAGPRTITGSGAE